MRKIRRKNWVSKYGNSIIGSGEFRIKPGFRNNRCRVKQL